ncbi:hypothetical protein [Limobrevibacterium gyesilva]|uniref:Uncharacterized protein n=1 Tax=Limobrevibacterium gyesilva TaxID=2991712 RepID=A0AA42CIW0_9PROT|nr:hypothetical protein [Limobrevibacterium gyesilva]MCW3476300.1 hypothetical protein [Limobrevibacterium gyesilva]
MTTQKWLQRWVAVLGLITAGMLLMLSGGSALGPWVHAAVDGLADGAWGHINWLLAVGVGLIVAAGFVAQSGYHPNVHEHAHD